jgi:putative membrane protein
MTKLGMFFLASVLLCLPIAAFAQSEMQTATQSETSTLEKLDRNFILDAAHGGMMEVDLARVALDRATNTDVKAYAQKMIDDHTAANDELTKLAASKGVTVPVEPDANHKADMDSAKADLTKRTGADFDREYMKMQEAAHEKMLKMFEKTAQSAKDADVKAFASKSVPTVKSHWQTAHDWNASMKDAKPSGQ